MIGMIRLRSLRHLFLFKVVSSCPTFTLNIIISSTMSPESGSWQIFFTMPTEKSTLLPQTGRHFVRQTRSHTKVNAINESLFRTWRNWVWACTLPNHFLFCMWESQSRLSGAFCRAALSGRWKVDFADVYRFLGNRVRCFSVGPEYQLGPDFANLVPRVFSLSNMAAAGEKTLAHSELKRSLIGAFHYALIRTFSLVYSFQNKDG